MTSLLNFQDLTDYLLQGIQGESIRNFKALEAQKVKHAQAEDYQKAQAVADKLKNMKFFDRIEDEELNQYYLEFLYEAEALRLFREKGPSAVWGVEVQVSPQALAETLGKLEANNFESLEGLLAIQETLAGFRRTVVASVLATDPSIREFGERLRLLVGFSSEILKEFEAKIGAGQSLLPELWEALTSSPDFRVYLDDVGMICEAMSVHLAILKILKESDHLQIPELDGEASLLSRTVPLVDELLDQKSHLKKEVHERIKNKALLATLVATRNSSDANRCSFCGLPVSQNDADSSDYRNLCSNLVAQQARISQLK